MMFLRDSFQTPCSGNVAEIIAGVWELAIGLFIIENVMLVTIVLRKYAFLNPIVISHS